MQRFIASGYYNSKPVLKWVLHLTANHVGLLRRYIINTVFMKQTTITTYYAVFINIFATQQRNHNHKMSTFVACHNCHSSAKPSYLCIAGIKISLL